MTLETMHYCSLVWITPNNSEWSALTRNYLHNAWQVTNNAQWYKLRPLSCTWMYERMLACIVSTHCHSTFKTMFGSILLSEKDYSNNSTVQSGTNSLNEGFVSARQMLVCPRDCLNAMICQHGHPPWMCTSPTFSVSWGENTKRVTWPPDCISNVYTPTMAQRGVHESPICWCRVLNDLKLSFQWLHWSLCCNKL